jgi:hypothetical protein
MARKGQQIKNVIINVTSKGGDETLATIKALNSSLESASGSALKLGSSLSKLSGVSTSLGGITKSIQSLNKALDGTSSINLKKLDSYIENLEILESHLKDVQTTAAKTAAALNSVGSSDSKAKESSQVFNKMAENVAKLNLRSYVLIDLLEKIERNTGKTSARVKQARDYISDLDVTTGRVNEEMADLVRHTKNVSSGMSGMSSHVTGASKGIEGLSRNSGRMGKHFGSLTKRMSGLAGSYAFIVANIYAVSEAFRVLKEASSLDRMTTQAANFSAAISGINVQGLASEIQKASDSAITFKDSLEFATKATAFNFTPTQIRDFTTEVRKASIALNRDFSDSMDRVIRGISKMEVEILDELGVVTRLEPAFKKYATQIGKTTDQLSDMERQTALAVEVMTQLRDKYSGIDPKATGWEKLGVAVKDLTTNGLVKLSKALDPVAEKLSNIIRVFSPAKTKIDLLNDSISTFNTAIKSGNVAQASAALAEYYRISSEGITTAKEEEKAIEDKRESLKLLYGSIVALSGVSAALWGKAAVSLVVSNITTIVGAIGVMVKAVKTLTASMVALAASNPLTAIATVLGALGVSVVANKAIDVLVDKQIESDKALSKAPTAEEIKKRAEDLKAALEGAGWRGPINEQTAAQAVAWGNSLKAASLKLSEVSAKLKETKTPAGELYEEMKKFSEGQIPKGLANVAGTAKTLSGYLSDLKIKGIIPKDVTDLDDYIARLKNAVNVVKEYEQQHKQTEKLVSIASKGNYRAEQDLIDLKIRNLNTVLDSISRVEGAYSKEQIRKYKDELAILNITKQKLELEDQISQALANSDAQLQFDTRALENKVHLESEVLELKLKQLETQRAILARNNKDTRDIDRQIADTRSSLDYKRQDERKVMEQNQISIAKQYLDYQKSLTMSKQAQYEIAVAELALRQKEIDMMTDALAQQKAQQELDLEKLKVSRQGDAAPYQDASFTLNALSSLNGLTDLQSSGLDMAKAFSDTFAAAKESGMDFIDFLQKNGQGFTDFAVNLANSANSMFQAISAGRVDALNAEIAAEKARDGKSAESLAKIKKLEAAKIKEEAKAKKASVVISTASAMMRAVADLGPIAGTVMAGALGVMGAMQLANISKAEAGQIAALNASDASSALKITGGTRDNSVDVSKAATAGEYAFLSGAAGTGTANNFKPSRAVGGYVPAGTSITVGERGAETITPAIPVNVSPSGQGGGSTVSIQFSPVFSPSTIDGSGMEELFSKFSRELYEGLERELNANNLSLKNLG